MEFPKLFARAPVWNVCMCVCVLLYYAGGACKFEIFARISLPFVDSQGRGVGGNVFAQSGGN